MPDHEHLWTTDSTHPTSEGVITYQRCRCGGHRVALSPRVTRARTAPRPQSGR